MGWGAIGCYHATNLELGWRLPLALSCAPPLALLAGLFFVPGKGSPGHTAHDPNDDQQKPLDISSGGTSGRKACNF